MKEPDLNEWAALYGAAVEFKRVAPWEGMLNTDFFAVANPSTGELGYCAIMGAGKIEFGLSVFLGDRGLRQFARLMSGKDEPKESILAPKLGLLFVSRPYLHQKDLAIIRSLNLTFRGRNAWPLFRSEGFGYLPWFLDRDEAIFMTAVINQSLYVAGQVARRELRSLEYGASDSFYVRRLVEGNWRGEWQKLKIPRFVKEADTGAAKETKEVFLKLLRNRKLAGSWQMDLFILPVPIEPKSGRPYYPLCFLVVDGESGIIVNFELTEPGITITEKRSTFLKMLEKSPRLPAAIQVKSRVVRDLIEPVTAALGITVPVHPLRYLEKVRREISKFGE
jgi:hypothetical protein